MERRKLFYIMGIDWNWIYQRPQIFAEKLASDYQVTVLFPRSVLKWRDNLPTISNIEFRILWTLPYQEKNILIGKIAKWINKKLFRDIEDFSFVYVGYPLYARYVPEDYRGKVIYDCMDDHEALYPDPQRVDRIIQWENKLIHNSDLVVASSNRLLEKVNSIAGQSKGILIRNGVKITDIYKLKLAQQKEKYHICYIGTIAEWFDYELLAESLRHIDNIQYHLVGPVVKKVFQEGIVYEGVVQHENLGDAIKEYDCLIMPFQVNDIVLSVNPVKLYEYIAFGKCIISVDYPEVDMFRDFVYLYKTAEEYISLLEMLKDQGFPPKYTKDQQEEFLQSNTWDMRYEALKREL